jgi:uncharacterized protein (DUF433 family)
MSGIVYTRLMPPVKLDFDIGSYLESDPEMEGRPQIRGTRVHVQKIGVLYGEGLSAAEMAEEMDLDVRRYTQPLRFTFRGRPRSTKTSEQDAEYFRLAEARHSVALR